MGLAVKPAYALALKGVVADHPEQTLRAPPLLFRRRPPQSNYPPDTVRLPVYGSALRNQILKGWYPKGDSAKTSVLASLSPTYPVHLTSSFNIKL